MATQKDESVKDESVEDESVNNTFPTDDRVALKKDGVTIRRSPDEIFELELKGWERI